jgi:hypothetical protein
MIEALNALAAARDVDGHPTERSMAGPPTNTRAPNRAEQPAGELRRHAIQLALDRERRPDRTSYGCCVTSPAIDEKGGSDRATSIDPDRLRWAAAALESLP